MPTTEREAPGHAMQKRDVKVCDTKGIHNEKEREKEAERLKQRERERGTDTKRQKEERH